MMRNIFFGAAAVSGVSAAALAQPAATQYPFCIQGVDNPGYSGCSYSAQRRILSISKRTVEWHLQIAMQKLGAKTRSHSRVRGKAYLALAHRLFYKETSHSVLPVIRLAITAKVA
jgi:hypothetical protein